LFFLSSLGNTVPTGPSFSKVKRRSISLPKPNHPARNYVPANNKKSIAAKPILQIMKKLYLKKFLLLRNYNIPHVNT